MNRKSYRKISHGAYKEQRCKAYPDYPELLQVSILNYINPYTQSPASYSFISVLSSAAHEAWPAAVSAFPQDAP